MTISIYAAGHWDWGDSYGLIAGQLARHLEALGVTVSAQGRGRRVVDNQPRDVRAIVERNVPAAPGGVLLGYPTHYGLFGDLAQQGKRMAITMWESSKIPRDWIAPLNRCHAIVVPSRFCAESFRQCGVTVPIYVVPPGIGDVYRRAERSPDRPLTFLAFLDRGARKGGITALQAFLRAFGDDTRYQLLLKWRKPRVAFTFENPNIDIIHRHMSEEELYQLYLQCDVMINPNKGEGFGLLPREFAATGGIALTTNWGGTADDLEQWGWPLPYTLERADWRGHQVQGQDLGVWATVDEEETAHVLRAVAANVEEYRAIAQARAPHVAAMYSWRRFATQILSIWRQLHDG